MSVIVGGLVLFSVPTSLERQGSWTWDLQESCLRNRIYFHFGGACRVQPRASQILAQTVTALGGYEVALPFIVAPDPVFDVADELFSTAHRLASSHDRFAPMLDPLRRLQNVLAHALRNQSVAHIDLHMSFEDDASRMNSTVNMLAECILSQYSDAYDAPNIVVRVGRSA